MLNTNVVLCTEIMNNCARDGGFCINVIPPQPPRRRQQQRRRQGTRTRKGSRTQQGKPDPASLGAQHARLPASAGGGVAATAGAAAAAPGGYVDPNVATGGVPATINQTPDVANQGTSGPFSFFDSLFGPAPAGGAQTDPMLGFFGLSMFRKKRQAPMDPEAAAEIPRIAPGESMFNFLNAHCRKSEMDFGCHSTGYMCCLPHLK